VESRETESAALSSAAGGAVDPRRSGLRDSCCIDLKIGRNSETWKESIQYRLKVDNMCMIVNVA
jgi:hypothetical protein